MEEILTAGELSNDNFYHDAPRKVGDDKHRREAIFDKGDFAFRFPKGAATINPQAKQTKRDGLERLTDEFMESGGAITICPPGKLPKFRFGAFKPPSRSSGTSRVNDLSRLIWRGPLPNKQEERELIRRYRNGDEVAKLKLVESFHRLILSIAGQYSGPPHNDLMAAGLHGFVEAINRFNENRGYRLSSCAKHWIRKYIRLAIKDWRREGASGETRQDRYIFSNPNATAEEVVAAVGGTLANAEQAIARLDGGHEQYTTTEGAYEEGDNPKAPHPATSHEMSRMYGCLSRFQLSPQLRLHEPACGSCKRIGWIDELANYHIAEAQRRLAEVGRRQYAVELVERERIRIGYRAKAERYLYRDGSGFKDYARRLRTSRVNSPPAADAWAILCQEKNDRAQKSKEVAASHKTIRNHDPYKHLRPPKLGAGRKLKPRGEIWRDTRTTIPEKSLPLPYLPMLQARHGLFVKKNFSVSVTFAELHCSAI
jgi:hypothetical protein